MFTIAKYKLTCSKSVGQSIKDKKYWSVILEQIMNDIRLLFL